MGHDPGDRAPLAPTNPVMVALAGFLELNPTTVIVRTLLLKLADLTFNFFPDPWAAR